METSTTQTPQAQPHRHGAESLGLDAPLAITPCCLNELAVGCRGCVVSVGGDPETRRRLLEMGFCNGACIEAVRRAPLGDPIEFRLRGYHLSLRDEQARNVLVLPQL